MLGLFIWAGCSVSEPVIEGVAPTVVTSLSEPSQVDSVELAAIAAAESAAQAVGAALKGRLQGAMSSGGPGLAVSACADESQGLAALALRGSRARAGRASLRLRNPQNDGPDWVQAWLREQGERPSSGVEGLSVAHQDGEVVVGRYLAPITVEGVCLHCHGDPSQIPEAVRSVLSSRYPNDQATGYAVGDLRGAIWAEARVPGRL